MPTVRKLRAKNNLQVAGIDLLELDEAFGGPQDQRLSAVAKDPQP